jgi:hypothetical protein
MPDRSRCPRARWGWEVEGQGRGDEERRPGDVAVQEKNGVGGCGLGVEHCAQSHDRDLPCSQWPLGWVDVWARARGLLAKITLQTHNSLLHVLDGM